MNKYRILYVKGSQGVTTVKADTVNGFRPDSDSYVFRLGDEVVAVMPKANVASIQLILQRRRRDLIDHGGER